MANGACKLSKWLVAIVICYAMLQSYYSARAFALNTEQAKDFKIDHNFSSHYTLENENKEILSDMVR